MLLLFLLIIGSIVAVVGAGIGAMIGFGIIPATYKGKGVPKQERRFSTMHATLLTVGCAFLGFFGVCTGYFVYEEWDSGDYWADEGGFEFYRAPLGFPYEIWSVDLPTDGCIAQWHAGDTLSWSIICDVTHVQPVGGYVVGKQGPHGFDKDRVVEDFVFCTTDGTVLKATEDRDFDVFLDSLGIDKEIELPTLRSFYRTYWREH